MKCLSEECGLEVGFIEMLIKIQLFALSYYIKKEVHIFPRGVIRKKSIVITLQKKSDQDINTSCTLYVNSVFEI